MTMKIHPRQRFLPLHSQFSSIRFSSAPTFSCFFYIFRRLLIKSSENQKKNPFFNFCSVVSILNLIAVSTLNFQWFRLTTATVVSNLNFIIVSTLNFQSVGQETSTVVSNMNLDIFLHFWSLSILVIQSRLNADCIPF